MATLHRYQVQPNLPAPLAPLVGLAKNLWWSWNRSVRDLFADVDRELFAAVGDNPMALLARVPTARLDELGRDAAFVGRVEAARRALDLYLTRPGWFETRHGARPPGTVAYFSMEFGIHECLPVYSGGLGVLAGDHLKSASDLGVPLVGVGIAFSQGYFRQSLDVQGWQAERYPPNDWHDLPVSLVTDASGAPLLVKVALPVDTGRAGAVETRDVVLGAWRVDVGRVPLILLDANLEANRGADRALTNTLYGGDRAHRIRQELLLGVGGFRMIRALGFAPAVCHMNEGHSAFLALERVRQLVSELGVPFEVAAEIGSAGNVFTTHTPVPAGNDAFAHDLIAPYLDVIGRELGKSRDEVARIGRADVDAATAEFSMPVLAIRMADRYNGVSELHGREARAMWRLLWPTLPEPEVPIGSVTNGIHVRTWLAPAIAELFGRHMGADFCDAGADPTRWEAAHRIPDGELWEVHERQRAGLVDVVRRRLAKQAIRDGLAGAAEGRQPALDPKALTIGFARRFATYKRGALLLRDRERLAKLLDRPGQSVQLVFSGKAHPQDWGGKELIQQIVRASREAAFAGRIVFVEDYDMGVARELVGGVDVWLNTPRRPLEASGTSGMKAAMNGALHASILDGWWCEAYAGDNGFAVGRGEEYPDPEYGDRVEAEALYRLLEEEIVPAFYDRGDGGLPRRWIAKMKRSIASVGPVFNTNRMVQEYVDKAYVAATARYLALAGEGQTRARAITEWKTKARAAWPNVTIESVVSRGTAPLVPGAELSVSADVVLAGLSPNEVQVELYHGRLDGHHAIAGGTVTAMRHVGELGGGRYRFEGSLEVRECGEHAFAVRVLPHHELLPDRYATRLVAWH